MRAVGVPRCSCSRRRSLSPEEFADCTKLGRTSVPRLRRMDVGINRRISFANAERRVDGEREVVTRGLGSTIPERWAYSSSRDSWISVGAVSSYL